MERRVDPLKWMPPLNPPLLVKLPVPSEEQAATKTEPNALIVPPPRSSRKRVARANGNCFVPGWATAAACAPTLVEPKPITADMPPLGLLWLMSTPTVLSGGNGGWAQSCEPGGHGSVGQPEGPAGD